MLVFGARASKRRREKYDLRTDGRIVVEVVLALGRFVVVGRGGRPPGAVAQEAVALRIGARRSVRLMEARRRRHVAVRVVRLVRRRRAGALSLLPRGPRLAGGSRQMVVLVHRVGEGQWRQAVFGGGAASTTQHVRVRVRQRVAAAGAARLLAAGDGDGGDAAVAADDHASAAAGGGGGGVRVARIALARVVRVDGQVDRTGALAVRREALVAGRGDIRQRRDAHLAAFAVRVQIAVVRVVVRARAVVRRVAIHHAQHQIIRSLQQRRHNFKHQFKRLTAVYWFEKPPNTQVAFAAVSWQR